VRGALPTDPWPELPCIISSRHTAETAIMAAHAAAVSVKRFMRSDGALILCIGWDAATAAADSTTPCGCAPLTAIFTASANRSPISFSKANLSLSRSGRRRLGRVGVPFSASRFFYSAVAKRSRQLDESALQ
jgi:hypothetical protein